MRMFRLDRSILPLLGAVVLGFSTASCSKSDPALPTPTADNVPVVTESYVGSMPVNGSGFYSFSTTQAGNVMLTLLDFKEDGASSGVLVSIGIGQPIGTTCTVSTAVTVNTSTTPQLSTAFNPGVYCARIGDVGNMTATATFVLNIAHPR
jgi:hypothetical protein